MFGSVSSLKRCNPCEISTSISKQHSNMSHTKQSDDEEGKILLSDQYLNDGIKGDVFRAKVFVTFSTVVALVSLIVAVSSVVLLFTVGNKQHGGRVVQDPCIYNPLTCNIDPQFTPNYTQIPERVLVIAAHPDDIETCAGGTLAKWSAAGSEIYYVMITNGDKGTHNRSITEKELGPIRQQEQIAAGKVIGVKDIFFLNVTDGGVTNDVKLRYYLTYYIRLVRPTVLLTWNPTYHFSLYKLGLEHSDHRTSGAASLDTVWPTAADFLYFPEQNLEPYRPSQVLLFRFWNDDAYRSPQENIFVELSEQHLETKIQAIFQHKSQIKNANEQKEEREFLTNMATRLGKPENTKYAEWFTLVRFNQ